MKRTPLRRGTSPLRRRTPLRPKTELRRSGTLRPPGVGKAHRLSKDIGIETTAERSRRREAERYLLQYAGVTGSEESRTPLGEYDHGEYVRWVGCALLHLDPTRRHRCQGDLAAAHVRSKAVGGDWADLVGLCAGAHVELDEICSNDAEIFERSHGVDLRAEADRMAGLAAATAAQFPGRWDTDRARTMRRRVSDGSD